MGEALRKLEALVRSRLEGEDLRKIARDVVRLSDAFTTGRSTLLPHYLDSHAALRAYVSLFLPINAAKVLRCLNEAGEIGAIPEHRRMRLLDLGCGPGSASLAASLFFARARPSMELDLLGIDRSAAALREAGALFDQLKSDRHRFQAEKRDIASGCWSRRLSGEHFDIVIASNLINELDDDGNRERLCLGLIDRHLSPGGLLILIDPALRETTRPLMKLRDALLRGCPAIDVCGPCLHRQPCPMLAANRRDWCHVYLEWERPGIVREVDELTRLDHRLIKLAYLILQKQGAGGREETNFGRVVSSPLVSKGKRELVVCGADGALKRVMRQDKDETDDNRDFSICHRGDVVVAKGDRIKKDIQFRRVRAWQP